MERYSKSFKVQFSETDFTFKLKLYALINKMQETSSLHAEKLGMGYDALEEYNLAWIISKYQIYMDSYPKWDDTITLETWPSGKDKIFAMRSFAIYNQNKEKIGSIASAYVLVDAKTGRLQRTSALPIEYPAMPKEEMHEFLRLRIPKDYPIHKCTRKVNYTDLDINMHMNNACYVQWIEDCFTLEQHKAKIIKDIQVNFISGATIGEEIDLSVYKDAESVDKFYILGKEKHKGREIFKASLRWASL